MDDPNAIADLRRDLKEAWRSARLVYCPVTEDDIAFLDKMNTDPVTFGMGGGSLLRPQGKETAKGLAALLAKSYLAAMVCLVPTRVTDEPPERIGFVCLGMGGDHPTWPTNASGSQALGISLAAEHQGKGYGTEAVRWVLDWAFHFGNLHRVELGVLEYNLGARRVYERVGFVLEGRRREVTFSGGRYWDLLLYSVLKREWLTAAGTKESIQGGQPGI